MSINILNSLENNLQLIVVLWNNFYSPPVSSSRMESLSSQQDSASDFHSAIDTLSEQDEGTMTPPSKQATPATSPQSSFRCDRPGGHCISVKQGS